MGDQKISDAFFISVLIEVRDIFEKQQLKKSHSVTQRQTTISIKISGSEKPGNKELRIRSVDTVYSRRYKIEKNTITNCKSQWK